MAQEGATEQGMQSTAPHDTEQGIHDIVNGPFNMAREMSWEEDTSVHLPKLSHGEPVIHNADDIAIPNIGAPSDMMDAGATYKERINVEDTHDTQTNLFNDESPNGGDDMVDGGHTVGEDGHLVDSVKIEGLARGSQRGLDRGSSKAEGRDDGPAQAWGWNNAGRRATPWSKSIPTTLIAMIGCLSLAAITLPTCSNPLVGTDHIDLKSDAQTIIDNQGLLKEANLHFASKI